VTGLERVKAAFKGRPADRVASYPIVSGLAAGLIGKKPGDYYTDYDVMLRSQVALYREMRPDVVVLMADLFCEVEAMGARVEFPEDDVPRLRSYLLGEDKGVLDSLAGFDPLGGGRMSGYLGTCARAAAEIKDSAVGAVLCGPWTLAVNLRGAENLIVDAATDPEFVHRLMAFTSGIARETGSAAAAAGVGLSFSEAPASLSLISPRIFREFVMPYQRQVISHLREKRVGVTLHVCGFIDPIMEDLLATGCAAVSIDEPSSLGKMLAAATGKAVTIGNVPTGVFVGGTREEIDAEIRRCLAAAEGRAGFILASGCEISTRGDLDNVRWFCTRAAELGRYQ
jgi:uroporphyrinogen decarboxylase